MNLQNILQNANYWYKNAFETNHARKYVFLEVLSQLNGPAHILEIGATGGDMQDPNYIHGSGGSSFYFAEYVRQNGGSLTIVDINPQTLENCKIMLEDFVKDGVDIRFICSDGLEFLKNNNKFDFIYLDGPDEETFTFEAFRLVDRYKSKVLIDDANGWDRSQGKCVRTRKYYQDYKLYKCGTIHEMIAYDKYDQKLWICGMFRGDRSVLEKTIQPIIKYFNGLICVVDSRASKDDIDWLNSIKGDGEVIVKKWVNDHSHTMNETLFTDKMKFPDYFLYLDETDKPNLTFVKRLRDDVKYWHKNNIGAVWLDHPFIIRYHTGVRFAQSPHWTIINILGRTLNLTSIDGYMKESYLFNLRDNDKLRSAFLSPIKYWYSYPPFSNHTNLLYSQFGQETWAKHESIRIKFQLSCQQTLGLDSTVDALKYYMINNVGKYPNWFEQTLEDEVNLKDAFRLFVLNEPWQNLAQNRFDWSYFKFKNNGEINQKKASQDSDYTGLFNLYKLKKGEQTE